jgi:hypothetical protein
MKDGEEKPIPEFRLKPDPGHLFMDNYPDRFSYNYPKRSDWKCHLFGADPEKNEGIMYNPAIGKVPNFFIRWMMKICLGYTWVKKVE